MKFYPCIFKHVWPHSDLLGLIQIIVIVFGEESLVIPRKSQMTQSHPQIAIRGPVDILVYHANVPTPGLHSTLLQNRRADICKVNWSMKFIAKIVFRWDHTISQYRQYIWRLIYSNWHIILFNQLTTLRISPFLKR